MMQRQAHPRLDRTQRLIHTFRQLKVSEFLIERQLEDFSMPDVEPVESLPHRARPVLVDDVLLHVYRLVPGRRSCRVGFGRARPAFIPAQVISCSIASDGRQPGSRAPTLWI